MAFLNIKKIPFCAMAVMALLFTACAKMGNPDGGWFDETPPKILGSTPADKATGVKGKKIAIFFDEYIKLDNPSEKVVVSPPQFEQPEITGQGRSVKVELQDSLKQNTTYTIDFSDAISDNNEGNPLGNYTFTFSTGDHIDTLEVSGCVIDASNHEPIKGILVGLYDDTADSAFCKKPMVRVSRTDGNGRFVIKGIAEGNYRVYALQDVDGNYMFSQKSEMLAFNHDIITPTSKPDIRQDTIWADSLHIRDISRTPYTHFLPDNIVLQAFNEVQTDRYFLKSERKEPESFSLFFSYGDSRLPEIKGLDFDEKDAFVIEPSLKQDSITYWLRDTALVNRDTLSLAVTYMATDSTGTLQQQTDTLELLSRNPYAKRLKAQQEEYDKWKKKQERLEKKGKPFETEFPAKPLEAKYDVPSVLDPDQSLGISFPTPLLRSDTAAIHLYEQIDTAWYVKPFMFGPRPDKHRAYTIVADWTSGAQYSLEIDTLAFTDIYGKTTAPYKQGFKVRSSDEYSNIELTITGMKDTAIVVQLLSGSDKMVKEVTARDGVARLNYVRPGEYYLRMFIDSNGNEQWDTGEYAADRQPEQVYYYPEKIECREKWDLKETWNPTATELSRQKPSAIKKQKDDTRHTIKNRNMERARSLGLEYIPK